MRKICLKNGIGDCFVYESRTEFQEVGAIYWATPARKACVSILEITHPHITHHNVYEGFDTDAFPRSLTGDQARNLWLERVPRDVENWAMEEKFRQNMPYCGSKTLKTTLCRVRKPARKYWVIQHDTPLNGESQRRLRALDKGDWREVLKLLHERRVKGCVLNTSDAEPPPDDPSIINLIGQTTVAQSIELLKRADGYVGIDSWMSTLAAQLFDVDHLLCKVINPHGLQWGRVYRCCTPPSIGAKNRFGDQSRSRQN